MKFLFLRCKNQTFNMKPFKFIIVVCTALFLYSCGEQAGETEIIGKKELQLDLDRMTPEVLWSFGRVGGIEVSPDYQHILFSITYYDIKQNKGNRDLYVMKIDGTDLKQLTKSPENEFNAIWKPDGSKIGYLSSKSGTAQLWEMNPDGTGKKKISDIEGGITGFSYSPKMNLIAYSADVSLHERDLDDLYEDLPKADGKVINRMMFRHWDEWRETYSHLFLADYDGLSVTNPRNIMEGEPWDFPMKPFWGMEQLSWAPNGLELAYSCKKKESMAYAISTNSDIYIHDIETGMTRNFTRGMMGYDLSPEYSPDGKMLAWESMERDGYEADKNRLIVYNFDTKQKTDYTQYFDQDVHSLRWSDNSQAIYFLANWYGTDEVFRLTMEGEIRQLTNGIHDYVSIQYAGDVIVGGKQSMSMPTEIFSFPSDGGDEAQLSFTNEDILEQLTMGKIEKRWIETTDNKKMLTWVIFPPHFNPARKYPALLYCQGGPQSTVSQFWSYRWNFQMMAANDYIIIAPNRRGVPGFGQEWKEQISGDYSGQNMKDLLQAIDVVSEEPYIDPDLLGAVGASYGGYSVFWLAGNHEGRFRCLIAHDGIYNQEAMYTETEEQWFPNFDLGGAPWESENPVAQNSYANSPHKFVTNWETPILIIHGQRDYRIAVTQAISAFNAAQLLDVPSQFLYFPNENHWVLSPQNGILWQRTFFKWLDSWLKKPGSYIPYWKIIEK
jgi:dipeptidyl aminopeptidase/acylaminoacyl peptidase